MKLTSTAFLKNLSVILMLSVLFFLSLLSTGQNGYQKELKNLDILEEVKTEKVHLHLDRTIYAPGEDIWFKAYLLEGTFHTLTSTSNNLHVELISPNGEIVSDQVVLIHNGVGSGDIHLSRQKLKEGIYQLRAYTNFMRNFDNGLFFTEKILVQSSNIDTNTDYKLDSDIHLQFFPEGGILVQDVLNRVAFKAINEKGLGTNISFTIVDNTGSEVLTTKSEHRGMGQFLITPKANNKYFARIELSDHSIKEIPLSKVSSGYSLFVGNQFNDLLDFTICTSPDNVHNQKISYIIQSRGKLYSSNTVKMRDTKQLVRIKKEELPSGISSITVFNENNNPVCERLIYNQIAPNLKLNITPNKTEFDTREKVHLTIETTNEDGKPVPAQLSLAVIGQNIIDKQKEVFNNSTSISSSILLSSDLKGNIEDPGFYFDGFDKKKHYYLDLVLLTHGWRKYVWKEHLKADNFNLDFPYENGFTVTGTSKTLALKRPIPKSKVSLTMSDEGFYYHEVLADENGKFTFKNTHFMDSTQLVFQAYNKKDKRNTVIEVDAIEYKPAPSFPVSQKIDFTVNNNQNDIAEQAAKIKQIQDSLAAKNYKLLSEITVKAQKRRDLDDHFRLYTRADDVITVDEQYAGYQDIFDIIKGQVSSAQIFGFCPEVSVVLRGNKTFEGEMTSNSAAFLLDGMFVSANDICSLPISVIDKIEVLKGNSAAIFGSRGMNGIIAVYLKDAEIKWEYVPIGIHKVYPKGYYRAREFYSPNYETAQQQFEGPDYRNTIFWEPMITTNKDGLADVTFFNSDDPGNFNIKVEGVGLNGGLGNTETNFMVLPDKLSNY